MNKFFPNWHVCNQLPQISSYIKIDIDPYFDYDIILDYALVCYTCTYLNVEPEQMLHVFKQGSLLPILFTFLLKLCICITTINDDLVPVMTSFFKGTSNLRHLLIKKISSYNQKRKSRYNQANAHTEVFLYYFGLFLTVHYCLLV